ICKIVGVLIILLILIINAYFVVDYIEHLDRVWLYVVIGVILLFYLIFVVYLVSFGKKSLIIALCQLGYWSLLSQPLSCSTLAPSPRD
ncbi:hypothetical protein chiPu_0023817, partial [Chiloscyllium punctatum]|nr:hypothetical protein [Chiloscyllium punctatum]